jgi:A/G-specific adenine glycosylase
MLQQTQVDRVLPKYHEWLDKYPSFEALADAPESAVTKTWYPLGYNIRPKRLHAIAREAVAKYGGKLPSDEATLLSFKGIGAYTAGAIRSFAFRERAAILDTNVARVLFRVFVGRGAPKAHAMKKRLWRISATVLPARRVFDFNQALMDFGATLCTARRPKCLMCPMASLCASYPYHEGSTKNTKDTKSTKKRKGKESERCALQSCHASIHMCCADVACVHLRLWGRGRFGGGEAGVAAARFWGGGGVFAGAGAGGAGAARRATDGGGPRRGRARR